MLYTSSMRLTTPMISSVIWSGRHEDVRVVLREAAHTEQAVQRALQLVAMDKAQLAHAQRQLTVGVRLAACRPARRRGSSSA